MAQQMADSELHRVRDSSQSPESDVEGYPQTDASTAGPSQQAHSLNARADEYEPAHNPGIALKWDLGELPNHALMQRMPETFT